MENNKQEQIHTKGFDITKYGKTKIGGKVVNDPTVIISPKETNNQRLNHKSTVLKALADQDLDTLRELSQYFYRTNGIYQKVLNYLATMYRYDWYLVPEVYGDNVKSEEIVTNFNHILNYLDNSYIKKLCGDIALNVVRDGAYYGYIVENPTGIVLQDLPIGYCRSRFNINGLPAVEFNMRFFDEQFPNAQYRLKVLKMFPKEFSVGYLLYKQGKLPADNVSLFENSCGSWYLLEPNSTVKFSLNKADIPVMVNAIPEIIDLDSAQELDRRKQLQKLLKIIVQKLPLDKNGDLIFDVDEAYDIHKNAVEMLRNAIGVDVLTTFTDVDSVDISDKSTSTSKDDLEKVERAVFNAMGLSKNIFNTDGNLSLEKSILNDEGSVRNLLLQFAIFFDKIVQKKSPKKKKYNFRLYMLETTQYNYKELSKMYKEHVQLGYSKMLPQIALGHSQSSILNTAYFENEILKLSEIMIPPLMSSTMSSEDILGNKNKTSNSSAQKSLEDKSSTTGGRPEKADSEKSEKTIQNKESMN